MRFLTVILGAVLALLVFFPGAAAAQESTPDAGEVIRNLNSIDSGHLALFLIFGTGFIASVLWGVARVISAFRQDLPNGDVLLAKVAMLESRLEALEQALGATALTDGRAVEVR